MSMFENVVTPRLHVKQSWVQPIANLPVTNNILDIRSEKEDVQLKESLERSIRAACHEDGEAVLPDLLLWDEKGLRYFEEVTYTPSYYLTNEEIGLLERHNLVPPGRFRHGRCFGLLGTYDDGREWLRRPENKSRPKIVLSLGSTLGSLPRAKTPAFLSSFCLGYAENKPSFLVGLDGCKQEARVLSAYNDPDGINRRFIKNGLVRANELMGHDAFDLDQWDVKGFWDAENGSHNQYYFPRSNVNLAGNMIPSGRKLLAVKSHKYDAEDRDTLCRKAGLQVEDCWASDTDYNLLFLKPTHSSLGELMFHDDPSFYAHCLMAACWASHYNMSTRIIDQKSGRTTTGHADGIHSRTLEILNSFGLVDPIIRQGVPDVEMCYWGPNKDNGEIERRKRLSSQSDSLSQYGQMLVNQGGLEQILLHYLSKMGRIAVEWNTRAETLTVSPGNEEGDDDFPVAVGVTKTANGNDTAEQTETIHARYVIACDGAQSCTRTQLEVPMESHSEHSTWGVIDIVPITDFPDIRQSCAIQCPGHGSIMTAPRENRLVRFYIQIKGDKELERMAQNHSDDTPRALINAAERWISPYKLSYKHCDWWSIYPVGQRLVKEYRIKNRIFLAGDAAHTHSPKAGQGMNVSMQDTYNLVWKLGSVITGVADPIILDTYESERRPVAEELMKMDSVLVHAYEQEAKDAEGVDQVRDEYSGFMSGVKITYAPNMLVAGNEKSGDRALAKNIAVGMRIPSFPVVNQADGSTIPLLNVLPSNGCWRLIVFSGDLRRPRVWERLTSFAESFSQRSHLAHRHQTQNSRRRGPPLETLLVHASPRTSINLMDLPDIFHPFDDELGWDYWKTFADDDASDPNSGKAYAGYGIDKDQGCLVLCRPDQHVAWIGKLDEMAGLDNYFSELSR
ncbi:hypothetical protein CNMCM8927_005060 [Aspergillus lentulus]|uniref:Phenol 2-monooxygenase n=1 Tax=Aspergillus lentulus TaxID=293939 RepID=A0AAN5YXZ2_ASPLE|nr:hypothetical protein CNMCM7927_005169 [Aspergillus lentulus]KAF4197626.1 hypothetical protein CNMCM8694_002528 [Aspergillus lentulus]KAF4209857.1 hypothetical protein CNMCM8927_005060 [Aspergillus lentulus]